MQAFSAMKRPCFYSGIGNLRGFQGFVMVFTWISFLCGQLYFHWWRLASDIPVAAGFISYLFSFEPELYIFIIQCKLITDAHSLRHIRCHIDFL